MDKSPETDKQLPHPEGKPSGTDHPFVKGMSLKPPSFIEMSVDNGKRKVKIFPSQNPGEDFTAIDKKTGDEVELSDEGDRTTAINLIRDNPFRR